MRQAETTVNQHAHLLTHTHTHEVIEGKAEILANIVWQSQLIAKSRQPIATEPKSMPSSLLLLVSLSSTFSHFILDCIHPIVFSDCQRL